MQDSIIAKILLYPFSLIYMLAISVRNLFYDANLLKSTQFTIPIINVGNLAVGGAGKTPHVEYLIRLLRPYLDVGVLSRGYKRKSKGFRFVLPNESAELSGDEPKQYAMKFRDAVIAVSESRNTGIPQMLKSYPNLETIILDDAYQHRSVIPYLNILLTAYSKVYTQDLLLPAGRLREYASASERADRIIVTKCPPDMTTQDRERIINLLDPEDHQVVYFTYYRYYNPYYMYNGANRLELTPDKEVILMSAIANTNYLEDYLEDKCTILDTIKFEDHHFFTERDIETLVKIYQQEENKNIILLTTEKDATRLHVHNQTLINERIPIFILPIDVVFHFEEKETFDQDIKDFLLDFKS